MKHPNMGYLERLASPWLHKSSHETVTLSATLLLIMVFARNKIFLKYLLFFIQDITI